MHSILSSLEGWDNNVTGWTEGRILKDHVYILPSSVVVSLLPYREPPTVSQSVMWEWDIT